MAAEALPILSLGCGGVAVAALTVALEAVRRNRKLSRRLGELEEG